MTLDLQDGPGDDTDDKDEVTDDDKAEKEKERGETFSDVSSEPEEEDDQQIANIVVGQFEKVVRGSCDWGCLNTGILYVRQACMARPLGSVLLHDALQCVTGSLHCRSHARGRSGRCT